MRHIRPHSLPPNGQHAFRGPYEGKKKPLRALAVAEDAPAGAMTGRVGAGPNGAGPPPR
jgi:hypothetical protein